MRIIIVVLLVLAAAFGAVYLLAGRAEGPAVQFHQPGKFIGLEGQLDVSVEAPGGTFETLEAHLEQNGKMLPLFSLAAPAEGTMKQESEHRVRIARAIGRRSLPELEAGTARIVVTASRPVLYGLRRAETTASHEVQVRLTPPRVSVVSIHHFINHGGSEMVVYRVSSPGVESGVRVGDVYYPGFPARGAGIPDDQLRVAFFALTYDQDLATPIALYARDEAGNEGRGMFDYRVFPKRFGQGRIELSDSFFNRVVPEILDHAPELKASFDDPLAAFLKVNGELRRMNADTIASQSRKTAPGLLWTGAFRPLGNASIESGFADHRTYLYEGREVDRQVHLGYDLAVTVNIPVLAGNAGTVLHADYLGIYGNCVIIDHGMGVQSLYAHLASMDVKPGDKVIENQPIGRSGMTGLAGGDHLHFGMYVNGQSVNPVEWWDPHWIEDRVLRKIREAGGRVPGETTAAPAASVSGGI